MVGAESEVVWHAVAFASHSNWSVSTSRLHDVVVRPEAESFIADVRSDPHRDTM
jgi:hypothetical protein